MKKRLASVLVLAISCQLFGCSKSIDVTTATTESKTTSSAEVTTTTEEQNTSDTETTSASEESAQKTAKRDITDSSAFLDYLKNEVGATKGDSDSISSDQLRKGVYIENEKEFSLSNIIISDEIIQKPIANLIPFMGDLSELYWAKGSAASKGVRDYDLDYCVSYVRCSYDSEETGVCKGTYADKDYSVSVVDFKVSATSVNYYVFSEKANAMECFKKIVNRAFKDEKAYLDLVNTISGMTAKEVFDGIYTTHTISSYVQSALMHWLPAMDQDVKIRPRKSFKLEDLPSNVYELDEKSFTGHLTYNYIDKWYEVGDIWKMVDEPGYVTFRDESKHFSIELKGNVLVYVVSLDGFEQDGCSSFYYDEWPNVSFEENKTISSVCNDFGLINPYDVSIDEDLNDQLFYMTRNHGYLICSELYKRKN